MRVAIIDDNEPVRALLRRLVHAETDALVVGEADDGDHAAQAVVDAEADLVIVDYRMARVDGIEATRRILAARPTARVVAFTSADDEAVAAGFKAAGAIRHFDKAQIDELIGFVRELTGTR